MRKLYSGLPIYIFALALTCGGLFLIPAHARAAETVAMESSGTADNSSVSTGDTTNTNIDTPVETSISTENNTQRMASADTSSSDNVSAPTTPSDSTSSESTETPVTPPAEDTDTTLPSGDGEPTGNPETPEQPSDETPAPEQTTASDSSDTKKTPEKDSKENLNRWMSICEKIGNNLRKRKFKYGNSGTRSTYKAALSDGKRSNCALYVSWCLQEYGAIKKGRTFYVRSSGSIKKNFKKWGKKVKVIRMNQSGASANLEKGDVVCWAGIAHCNIYAGRNNSGERLWFDAGKSATYSGHSGSRFENVGAKTQSYLSSRRISYVIRIKDL